MTRNRVATDVRRRLPASIGASALALLVLAVAAGPAAAAAPVARAHVVDGTLHVTGRPRAERIVLRLSPLDRNLLQVDFGDDGWAEHTFDLATFDAIDVEAGNGDDTVRIDQGNGIFTTTESTRIAGNNGDDTLLGGSGAETFFGGRGDDLVDGNGGVDTAFLGKGDDVFVWDPGDASDVVEGEQGSDTMVFNGAGGDELLTAKANGSRVLFTRNLGNIVMDLDGIETIDVRALGGSDTITVDDVRGTDLERVDVDLAATLGGSTGDEKADTVKVLATEGNDSIAALADGAAVEVGGLAAVVRITHAEPALDTLLVDTLAGADDVAIDPALAALILVTVL